MGKCQWASLFCLLTNFRKKYIYLHFYDLMKCYSVTSMSNGFLSIFVSLMAIETQIVYKVNISKTMGFVNSWSVILEIRSVCIVFAFIALGPTCLLLIIICCRRIVLQVGQYLFIKLFLLNFLIKMIFINMRYYVSPKLVVYTCKEGHYTFGLWGAT